MSENLEHPLFARYFARLSPLIEREVAPLRRALLADLHGKVVELGAGSGTNFPHYPATVERVVAYEPEPYLRRLAEARAKEANVEITLVGGRAERLGQPAQSFDFAVATLVFCSIADPLQALREIRYVLRPGGELRFIEHVRGRRPAKVALQLALDRSRFWPLLAGGCHCGRDFERTLRAAGFTVLDAEERPLGPSWLHLNPHLFGRATALAP